MTALALEEMSPTLGACAHCALPVTRTAAVLDAAGQHFCCMGCATVYGILHREGLTRYYILCADAQSKPLPVVDKGRSFVEFASPEFVAEHCQTDPDGVTRCALYLEGMHCAACVWLVEKLPQLVPGVLEARVNAPLSTVALRFDTRQASLKAIAQALAALGYPPYPATDEGKRNADQRAMRKLLLRMGVAGACAGNGMLMALALYCGALSDMDATWMTFFRWGSLFVALPVMLFSARTFFEGAWTALRNRSPHMDLPVTVAILLGFAWGVANTVRGRGDIYFDTINTVVFLLLVGRWLRARQMRHAGNAAALLNALTPRTAHLWDGSVSHDVPLGELRGGHVVEVFVGETLPVDGWVLLGTSTLDRSLLTGESRPVTVSTGEEVHAGTINLSGRLLVTVEQAGAATRLGQIAKSVEALAASKAPIVLLADRIAGYFVSAVLLLAALTFGGWWYMSGTLDVAVDHAVALLIVTCPCALAMATPLTMNVALAQAAREGLLIKGGEVIERLGQVRRVVFDKTGTLTQNRMTCMQWWGDVACQPWVGALEAQVRHPLAQALANALPHRDCTVQNLSYAPGRGVHGQVNGYTVAVGSVASVGALSPLSQTLRDGLQFCRDHAWTPVLVAVDGAVVALAGLGDPLQEGAKACIKELRRDGMHVLVASGDDAQVVQAIGKTLDLPPTEALGALSPEDKVHVVQRSDAPTLMVGDGINDATALAAAWVGVAVHGGAEASLAAADVYAACAGIAPVTRLLQGARRTLHVIKRGLVMSLFYNVIGVGLAMAGVLSPLAAAILMPISSITVVSNAYRSRMFGGAS